MSEQDQKIVNVVTTVVTAMTGDQKEKLLWYLEGASIMAASKAAAPTPAAEQERG